MHSLECILGALQRAFPWPVWGKSWYFLKGPGIRQMQFRAETEQPCSWSVWQTAFPCHCWTSVLACSDLLKWQSAYSIHKFLIFPKLNYFQDLWEQNIFWLAPFLPCGYNISPKLFFLLLKWSKSMSWKCFPGPVCRSIKYYQVIGACLRLLWFFARKIPSFNCSKYIKKANDYFTLSWASLWCPGCYMEKQCHRAWDQACLQLILGTPLGSRES